MKKYFNILLDLHMYIGLFIGPFVIIFGVSAIFLNHPEITNKTFPVKSIIDRRLKVDRIPYDSSDLGTGKAICRTLGFSGEIDYVFKGNDNLSIKVSKPGLETYITVNTITDSVFIKQVGTGPLQATAYLHKMPGPHLIQFRKNAFFMKIWSVFADSTVYLTLFLTVSGIYLWYFLKIERKMGVYAICLGAIVFLTLLIFIL